MWAACILGYCGPEKGPELRPTTEAKRGAPGYNSPCRRAAEAPGAPDAAQLCPLVARPGVAAWHRRGAYPGAGPSGGNRCKHRLQRVPGGPAHGPMMEPHCRPDRAAARLGP